ncbi:hypothetical protein [Kineosporia sp. R_H_3]|uniref:hypothetical protein n=1 Tax=Kineosporia sp. R_H_3 TaxID=1961848 RepID=UPI00117AD3B3|nr:hypothetical protein [Kineosporia sp. R_H_3]
MSTSDTSTNQTTTALPPPVAVRSLAGGLLLMAGFTVGWASLAPYGWTGAAATGPVVLAVAAALAFAAGAVALFRDAGRFPPVTDAVEADRGRRIGRAYGLTFGVEGLAIFVVAATLSRTGNVDYQVPAIALVVGLHFYPMARIFDRTVDLWIASWVVAVAALGLAAVAGAWAAVPAVWSAVGVGTALGTAAYGVYMLREGRGLLGRLHREHPRD